MINVVRTVRDIEKNWIPYERAKFLVIGFGPKGGGLLATALDEFTAHRYARIYKEAGYTMVMVQPMTELKKVHDKICEFYF
jgi:hypothetical protein